MSRITHSGYFENGTRSANLGRGKTVFVSPLDLDGLANDFLSDKNATKAFLQHRAWTGFEERQKRLDLE